jgi:hypothetical protein
MALYRRKYQRMSEKSDEIELAIPDDVDPLTAEQRAFCTKWKIPIDEYLDTHCPAPSKTSDQALITEDDDESL